MQWRKKRRAKALSLVPFRVSSVQLHDVIPIFLPTPVLFSSKTPSPHPSIISSPFSPPKTAQMNSLSSSLMSSSEKGKEIGEGSSRSASASASASVTILPASASADHQQQPAQLSRYESQKRRDWNTFGQYLKNQRPPVSLSQCNYTHVLDFLRYLDQFGKTKVHLQGCVFFGQPEPPGPCTCPLRQAWGSLDALIGRLRAAYEENGGLPETNPFASGAIRVYLREVRDSQAKARGIPYKKKKKKRTAQMKDNNQDAPSFPMQSA